MTAPGTPVSQFLETAAHPAWHYATEGGGKHALAELVRLTGMPAATVGLSARAVAERPAYAQELDSYAAAHNLSAAVDARAVTVAGKTVAAAVSLDDFRKAREAVTRLAVPRAGVPAEVAEAWRVVTKERCAKAPPAIAVHLPKLMRAALVSAGWDAVLAERLALNVTAAAG